MKKHYPYIGAALLAISLFMAGCAADRQVKVLYSADTGYSQAQNQGFHWTEAKPGLAYADILVGGNDGINREYFLVKIDPHLFEFRNFHNGDRSTAKTLDEIHKQTGSVLTFNGAFFDKNFKSMGLLQDSQARSHKKLSSDLMNGVFAVANVPHEPMAYLFPLKDIPDDTSSFLIQNGPALIDNDGKILPDKDTGKGAARTALGIDSDGNVVLIILHQSLMNSGNALSLYQFAHQLKENPPLATLGLHSVLNLDGGPSTGVVVGGESFPEMNPVENAVITLPRTQKI